MIVWVRHRQSSKEGVRRGSGGGAGGKAGDEDLADFGHDKFSFGEFCSDQNNEDGGSSWRYVKASRRKQRLYQITWIILIACDVYPLLIAPSLHIRCLLGWILKKNIKEIVFFQLWHRQTMRLSPGVVYPWVVQEEGVKRSCSIDRLVVLKSRHSELWVLNTHVERRTGVVATTISIVLTGSPRAMAVYPWVARRIHGSWIT